jgi:cystathionine beta-lyase/cystathionine gamma-synthase
LGRCKARGVISVIDNTFRAYQPAATHARRRSGDAQRDESLNGHSDVTAGALAGSTRHIDAILKARKLLGTVLDPMRRTRSAVA